MIAGFAVINRLAAWLLVPYLAWVLYAAALNSSAAHDAAVSVASNPSGV